MKDGIETKAVVMTIITRSMTLLRLRAAIAPSTTPQMSEAKAAMTPSLAEVFKPSVITSMTWRPLCLSEGPKSKCRTISLR